MYVSWLGGSLADILVGHKAEITALAITSEGMRAVSTSLDDTMKMWDLRTAKVTKTISNVGKNVLQVRNDASIEIRANYVDSRILYLHFYVYKVLIGLENQLAITSETFCIRVWDLQTLQCTYEISDFSDYARIAISQDSKVLVCYLAGVNVLRFVFRTQNNAMQVCTTSEEGVMINSCHCLLGGCTSNYARVNVPNIKHADSLNCFVLTDNFTADRTTWSAIMP